MTNSNSRGKFIVVEGGDRSGKSSAIKNLENKNITKMRFPDRTTVIGSLINNFLTTSTSIDNNVIHLLFSSNRWEAKDQILKLLQDGNNLVVDRYSYSGVAYSAAKGLDLDWCKASDVGLPKPDLVVYFDLSPEKAALRGDYGQERYTYPFTTAIFYCAKIQPPNNPRYENVEFQTKVQGIFKEILKDQDNVVYLDADREIQVVHDEFRDLVDKFLRSEVGEIGGLWK